MASSIVSQKKGQPALSKIDFSKIDLTAKIFANHIEKNYEQIVDILLDYESFEVAQDEIRRTLDLLRSLKENKSYFQLRIGAVTSFLPKNQPLYALCCFVVVPSLMAGNVHFRIPHSMKIFFQKLLKALKLNAFFPNIKVSKKERFEFLRERSALYINTKTQESWPVSDAVIFTGTSDHAERLRLVFDSRTLFIANGSGHNPIVVTETANISKAVEATSIVQLYNQGQDCAAPNSILVHKAVYSSFLNLLRKELKKVKVGNYRDRSVRIGPISEPEDLVRIENILIENRKWIDPKNPGIVNAKKALVEPAIICKPLKNGGNFSELFAPIIFLQKYEKDSDLCEYFESPLYARNAMYLTLFGESTYVRDLIGKRIEGKVLHEHSSLIHNTHLHADGVERGTKPYGGNGYAASSISQNGKISCKATLPQRDIFEWVVRPLLHKATLLKHKSMLQRARTITYRDVQKILGMKIQGLTETTATPGKTFYIDSHTIKFAGHRYVHINADNAFFLLDKPNLKYIAMIEPHDIQLIRSLRIFLNRHRSIAIDEFSSWLYALSKKTRLSEQENRQRQLKFFVHIYQLLLGKNSGPRLAQFLLDIDKKKLNELLKL